MDDLTPEQQERIREIREALEQEMRESANGTTSKAAIKDLEELKSDFLDAIKQTVKYSVNESLKTKIAMWGYDRLIAEGKASADPLADILAGMARAKVGTGEDS